MTAVLSRRYRRKSYFPYSTTVAAENLFTNARQIAPGKLDNRCIITMLDESCIALASIAKRLQNLRPTSKRADQLLAPTRRVIFSDYQQTGNRLFQHACAYANKDERRRSVPCLIANSTGGVSSHWQTVPGG